MVNGDAQLYTIEGIAASLIILLTAYIVLNSTSIYTPGDSHINDMQLEVIGSDALSMMNMPVNGSAGTSALQAVIENNDSAGFNTIFSNILNNRTGATPDTIQFLANVTYVVPAGPNTGNVNTYRLNASRLLYGGEHAVRVSQWVIVDTYSPALGHDIFPECVFAQCRGKHAALVEVLLWRD